MRGRLGLAAVLVVAVLTAGTGIAAVGNDNDDDQPLTGSTLERASAAAREHVGGGNVVDSETGDDGAAYEVEVRLAGGRQVEVELNRDFEVTGQEIDDDTADDDDEGEADDGDDGAAGDDDD